MFVLARQSEKQVAITYNSAQLKRSLAKMRSDPYSMVLAATGKVEEEQEEEEEDDIK